MSPDSQTPEPLSRDLIERVMREQSWHYTIDSDGDIGGIWDDNMFYFFLRGDSDEILYVRGRWHHSLTTDQRTEAREVLDEWHLQHFWPKGYTRVDDNGDVRVYGEHVVDWEAGVTFDQLLQTIRCSISTVLGMFEELEQHFGKN
ncbi:MAG: YbjN domain-containing protein [Propionibacteriaceae bacterium]|jgi:hypothetical protein|nr:YbjN domain-containing protein [Propionibacteriaceae bacterium]